MFTMLTFYYIEQWRYFHPLSFPNIEPTPLPSTDVWNQPDGLRPHYSDQTNDFIDNAHIPSPDIVEGRGTYG